MTAPPDLRDALIACLAERFWRTPGQAAVHADALIAEFVAPYIARAAAAEAERDRHYAERESWKEWAGHCAVAADDYAGRFRSAETDLVALAKMYGEACWKMASAIACVEDLSTENQRLARENDHLRASLANSGGPCAYCDLPKEDWAKCASGFPGCARGDDAMLCPHVGGELAVQARFARLLIAFHDAIRRPLGVTPDSGAEFYDPRMADEAEARRASRVVLRELDPEEAAARAAALAGARRREEWGGGSAA